jgi:ribonuclease HI
MPTSLPRFVLETSAADFDGCEKWSFALRHGDGTTHLCATDSECGLSGNRLELLAVVRGLEALESPSSVTLITSSRYVVRGLLGRELSRMRETHEGENEDLWSRVENARRFHQVRCANRDRGPALALPLEARRHGKRQAAPPNRLVDWSRRLAASVRLGWERGIASLSSPSRAATA